MTRMFFCFIQIPDLARTASQNCSRQEVVPTMNGEALVSTSMSTVSWKYKEGNLKNS